MSGPAYTLPVNQPYNIFPIAFVRNTDPVVTWPDLVGPGMLWIEVTNDTPPWGAFIAFKVRNGDNSAWITLFSAAGGGSGSGFDADLLDGLDSTAFQLLSQKGAANGYASLDAGSKVPSAQLPALALTDISVVGSEAAQLALTNQEGDVVVRTDESKTYVHNGGTAGTMADYTLLQTPADLVLSVFGRTGAVVADSGDYAAFYQALHANLTALAGLTGAADRGIYYTGVGALALFTLTAFGRSLADDADAAAGRTTLGLGTIATENKAFPLTINEQTGDYTLVLTDADNVLVDMNKATAVNTTIPPNSDVAFPIGSKVPIRQKGAGQVTVVAGSGVTINTPETLKIKKQFGLVEALKVATNTWTLFGLLEAA